MKQLTMLDGFVAAENEGTYNAFNVTADEIIAKAKEIAMSQFKVLTSIESPQDAEKYIWASMQNLEQEVFACLFLDTKHHIIAFEKMFFGSIDSASVYPREIAKRALQLNAAALIVTHNHPSNDSSPSQADIMLTRKLVESLSLLDIRVLDHLIVGSDTYSLQANGDM